MTSERYPYLGRCESEKYFFDPSEEKKKQFPSLSDPPGLQLSVIVPSYNEEERCEYN